MTKSPLNLPGSQTEDHFHIAVAELLDVCLIPPAFYTTFPAGYGRLSKATAGRLRAKGMKPGMPDILIFQPKKIIGLELKAGRGTLTSAQRATHAQLLTAGVRVYLARNLDDVMVALNDAGMRYRAVTTKQNFSHLENLAGSP